MPNTALRQIMATVKGGRWMRQHTLWIALRFTALLLAQASHAADLPILVLNDTNEAPYTTPAGDGFLDVVAGEAFRRAGLHLRLVKLPAERALINADKGIEDGDLTRIAGLEKVYPNLIRVPEKLLDWNFAAFTRQSNLGAATWADLEPLSIGHIKGWKIYERSLLPGTHITTADDPEQLFAMLDKNRIDVALYERWMGDALVKNMNLRSIRIMEPSLAVREMYIYLNRRHANKVAAIAAALRAIKTEGLYRKICREKLAPLGTISAQCDVN